MSEGARPTPLPHLLLLLRGEMKTLQILRITPRAEQRPPLIPSLPEGSLGKADLF